MTLPAQHSGQLILALYAAPLLVAALWDLRSYRIPNLLCAAMLALFPLAALLSGQPVAWWSHVTAFAIFLAAGAVLFAFRLMGGGDVKLLAVTALWLGLSLALEFVFAVALLGGILAFVLLVLRSPLAHGILARFGRTPEVLKSGAAIPYGIAIAAGGLLLAERLPLLGQGI